MGLKSSTSRLVISFHQPKSMEVDFGKLLENGIIRDDPYMTAMSISDHL